jgi:hypothetical protein
MVLTSPPTSPVNAPASRAGPVAGSSLSSGSSVSSLTQSANISTNPGMSRDPQKPATQDDGQTPHEVQKPAATPDDQTLLVGLVQPVAVRPGLQPGPNGVMAFQAPVMPSCYPAMMMPPFVSFCCCSVYFLPIENLRQDIVKS